MLDRLDAQCEKIVLAAHTVRRVGASWEVIEGRHHATVAVRPDLRAALARTQGGETNG